MLMHLFRPSQTLASCQCDLNFVWTVFFYLLSTQSYCKQNWPNKRCTFGHISHCCNIKLWLGGRGLHSHKTQHIWVQHGTTFELPSVGVGRKKQTCAREARERNDLWEKYKYLKIKITPIYFRFLRYIHLLHNKNIFRCRVGRSQCFSFSILQ